MKSIWENRELPTFPRLDGDEETDVLVIGGGMAGLLTAYELTRSGVSCLVAEQHRIASGNTGRTTAKITLQHGLRYDRLIREKGIEAAEKYLAANRTALTEYEALCRELDCEFEKQDSLVYSEDAAALEREVTALERLGCPAELTNRLPLPLSAAGAVRVKDQAQFHPLKFLRGLLGGLRIYENTAVRTIRGTSAVTDTGVIRAKNIVCATHFPFVNRRGLYFMKLYQHRSYVLALRGAGRVGGMFISDKDDGLTFRDAGELLLMSGGGGRTGKSGSGWAALRSFAAAHFPEAEEAAFWAAQDCMSLDGLPYIGAYSPHTPGLYVAAGFNKWGMTGSMTAALLLRDRILGIPSDCADVFDPARNPFTRQLFINAAESVRNLLTPTAPRCPHLGCALVWNPAERSWDCPCHGSRFSEEGALLDNPAQKGMG